MPRYFSVHTVACMPRQHLEQLINQLKEGDSVRGIRFVCDSFEGKLLCEFEADTRELIESFLANHKMRPELILRVEHEW